MIAAMQSLAERFERDGFLVVRQIAVAEEVAAIRRRIVELFETGAGRREGAFFDFAGSDEDARRMRLPQLLDARSFAPELLKTRFFENAAALAREVLGNRARLVADHALVKPAHHGAATPWHQDDAFRDGFYRYNEISVWLALQETNGANGCLGFVRGPTSRPVLPHRSPGGDARVHALECQPDWSAADIEFCPLQPGDCTVHGNRTPHGAGANFSAQPRYGYVLVFGTPPVRLRRPTRFVWLQGRQEPRLARRRAWLRQGGLFVHGWRRLRQLPQIGPRELLRRLRAMAGG